MLRGPQGTLFGSGSVGGTLRYITNQPRIGETSAMLEANANIVAESDVGGHLKGMVNLPLGNTLAARIVGAKSDPSVDTGLEGLERRSRA